MDEHQGRKWPLELLEWWLNPASPVPLRLADGFTYDAGITVMSADDWVWLVRQSPRLEDVVLLGVVADSDAGSIAFECTDTATNLRHRVSWFMTKGAGALAKLTSTTAIIRSLGEDSSESPSR